MEKRSNLKEILVVNSNGGGNLTATYLEKRSWNKRTTIQYLDG